DDGLGEDVPAPDRRGFRGEGIRDAIADRLNAISGYVDLFGDIFPDVASGDPIDFSMVARAIAEFEFTQVYADAPIDKFARGKTAARRASEKRGALVFFGDGHCSRCHAVDGESNEMFSDFNPRVIAVPQVAPKFGVGTGD